MPGTESPYGNGGPHLTLRTEGGRPIRPYRRRWLQRPAATTPEGVSDLTRRLSRPRNDRRIAGVCAGLGRRFGLSSGVVRLLFVISCLLPGPQILIYLVLWALMPSE